MSKLTRLGDRMYALYGKGEYEGALEVVDAGFPGLDDDDALTATFWRICLLTRVGEDDEAVAALADALDRGWWYSEGLLRNDPDLAPLHGRQDWEALLAEVARRQAAAPAPSGMSLPSAVPRVGSVVALHAAAGREKDTLTMWEPVTALGYDLYAPASSVRVSSKRGSWDSIDQTITDVTSQALDHIDGGPIIIGGRSQGAIRAAQIAQTLDRVNGVILVAHAPTPASCPDLEVPTFILGGERDMPDLIDAMETFAAHQRFMGVPTRLDMLDDMGHWYPDDFHERLAGAIAWIMGHQ